MSRGREAAVKSCFIHTSGNVAGSIVRSSQQAQNLFTHTYSQLQLLRVPGTCSRRVSHCLIDSYHTISHRFNLSVSCGRTLSTCLHCKKSPFSNIRCWNMPHEVRPNELWWNMLQRQNIGVAVANVCAQFDVVLAARLRHRRLLQPPSSEQNRN